MNKLTEILATKAQEVAERRKSRSVAALDAVDAGPVRGFTAALRAKIAAGGFGLIAEIKKASPSKGLIRKDFNPADHARAYEARSEEHTSELQSLMRISYAVFCLKKQNTTQPTYTIMHIHPSTQP